MVSHINRWYAQDLSNHNLKMLLFSLMLEVGVYTGQESIMDKAIRLCEEIPESEDDRLNALAVNAIQRFYRLLNQLMQQRNEETRYEVSDGEDF